MSATIYSSSADGFYFLRLGYDSRGIVENLPGRYWDADAGAHELPADLLGPAWRELKSAGICPGLGAVAAWPPAPPTFSGSPLAPSLRALPLRDYQAAALEFLQASPFRCLLAALDMGLGKSLLALAAGIVLGGPRLIIVPAIVRSVWGGTDFAPGEIQKWIPDADVRILTKRKVIDTSLLDNVTSDTWVVCNYEILDYQERKDGKVRSNWLPILKQIPWKLIVLDEAHAIKKRKSKRTTAIVELRNAAPTAYRLALTGTPVHNRPKDLWQLLDWLAPGNFGAYWTFARRYADAHEGEFGWTDTGISNASELKHRLRWYMLRVAKCDVAHLLPAKTREVIAFPPTAKDAQELDKAASRLYRRCREEGRQPTKAEILCLSYGATSKKFQALYELIQARDGRIVVFLYKREVARELFRALATAGYPVFGIHGDIIPEKRIPILNDFRLATDGILIATMGVAGLGIDLSCASTAVFLDIDPVPSTMLQCEDRLWRPPQNAAVTIYYIVLRNTVDEQMARLVVHKLNQSQAILGVDKESAAYMSALDQATGELSNEEVAITALQNMLRSMFEV